MKSKMTKCILMYLLLGFVSVFAEQWQYLGLLEKGVLSTETHRVKPQSIITGTYYEGLHITFDGGRNWDFRLATNVPIPFISYEPFLTDSLFAIVGDSYSMGLYASADYGNIWHQVNLLWYPRRMGFDPIHPGYLYICSPDGILTSQDYGQSFFSANNGLPDLNILDLKGDGANQYEAYAVGEAFIAHTTDFGASWTDLGGLFGFEDYNPSRIEFEPNGPETLYVACWTYVARSFDRGATWEYTATPTTDNMAVACDPIVAGKLYVGSLGGGVLMSTDAGASFTSFNDNLGDLNIHCLEFDPQSRLIAGTNNGIYVYSFGTDIVNEFLASNKRTIVDEEGEFEDYIELYNDSANTIDLAGFFLSDDSADLTKWAFPDTSIPPGGFLLIWTDNDTEQGPLHTSFELDNNGEEVVLTMSDGITTVDYIFFGQQRDDVSTGRFPDGSAYLQPMVPTPETPNSGNIPPYLDYIERVPDNPQEGQQVTVTCRSYDEDGEIDSVLLYYDPGTGFVEVEMFDDGAHGDGDSLDTIFGGFIPGFETGTAVNYYMVAFDTDNALYYDPREAPEETYSYTVSYAPPALYINEFMAINETTIEDPQGDYDDWIEIYNPGDHQINLEGFYLTDYLSQPLQWAFPDTFIEAGGFLLIWADNDEGDPGLHTNFELSGNGEQVGFYDTDAHGNALIDSITFSSQYPDTSFGRYPDGSGNWMFFSSPTPGYPNLGGSGCDFVPGDINGDDNVMGNDVTYGVRYFKGLGEPPPDSCWNDSTSSWLYSGGDANGNCQFTGSDVTFLVAYFKGYNPEILWCPQTPPIGPVGLGGKECVKPSGDLPE